MSCMRTDSLLFIFFLVFMLGVFQNIAFENYFYWKFWWYDIMMHFLGGAIVSAILLWVIMYEFPESLRTIYFRFAPVVLFVLVVGIVWEVYEYHIGIDREYSHTYWRLDTAKDLFDDMVGGVVAAFFVRRA